MADSTTTFTLDEFKTICATKGIRIAKINKASVVLFEDSEPLPCDKGQRAIYLSWHQIGTPPKTLEKAIREGDTQTAVLILMRHLNTSVRDAGWLVRSNWERWCKYLRIPCTAPGVYSEFD